MLRVASVPVVPTSCADEAKAMERLTTSAVGWNAILRCFATLSGDNLKRTMFNMLQRPQATLDKYVAWKADTLRVFNTLSSGVLCEKLGYDAEAISETGKYRAVRPEVTSEHRKAAAAPVRGKPYAIEADGGECLLALHANTFPYNVADDVRHDVLWSERRLTADTIKAQLDRLLAGQPFGWYENVEALKSLPDVFHVHVFSQAPSDSDATPTAATDAGEDAGEEAS